MDQLSIPVQSTVYSAVGICCTVVPGTVECRKLTGIVYIVLPLQGALKLPVLSNTSTVTRYVVLAKRETSVNMASNLATVRFLSEFVAHCTCFTAHFFDSRLLRLSY